MIDLFRSVGATGFNVTWTDIGDNARRSYKGMSVAEIIRIMPRMLDAAIAEQLNLIVRPLSSTAWFIQLDDLKAEQLARIAPRIFLILETSPGNHQAWLALAGKHDKEFARRVRRGAGTDKRATGATRVAGSLNFKEKHGPDEEKHGPDKFPRVTIHTAQPGCMTTAADLAELKLVAPKEEFAPFTPAPSSGSTGTGWPSYQKALNRAPPNSDGTGPDRSNADLRWCMTAIGLYRRGEKETAAELMKVSEKARQKGEAGKDYAEMIADTAARFVRDRPLTAHRTAEHSRR